MITRPKRRVGVLDPKGLWAAEDAIIQRVSNPPAPGAALGEVLDVAAAYGLSQLWIHPSWGAVEGDAGAWAVDAKYPEWLVCRRERRTIPLVQPGLDVNPAGLSAAGTTWHRAPDAATLLEQLMRFGEAVGETFFRHPVPMGAKLIRNMATVSVSGTVKPKDFPKPALASGNVDAFKWIRPLTADEQSKAYIHGYDKNAMFLGACSSLNLGLGEPEHLIGEDIRWTGLPGYYFADISREAPVRLPNPFAPAAAHWGDEMPIGPRWYAAPTIELALKLGYDAAISEAYVWPEHRRVLEPWYRLLRDARASLKGQHANIALTALKQTYSQTIGWLDSSKQREKEEPQDLFRPDWRHAIIAQANANLYRKARGVWINTEQAPVAVGTDCLYYVSDIQDPRIACPAGIALGEGLGDFKIKASESLSSHRSIFQAVKDRTLTIAEGLSQLQSALKTGGD